MQLRHVWGCVRQEREGKLEISFPLLIEMRAPASKTTSTTHTTKPRAIEWAMRCGNIDAVRLCNCGMFGGVCGRRERANSRCLFRCCMRCAHLHPKQHPPHTPPNHGLSNGL